MRIEIYIYIYIRNKIKHGRIFKKICKKNYFIFMLAYVIFILEIFTAQVSLFFFCPFPLYYLLRSCKIISFSQPKTKRERECVIVVGDQNFL